MARRRVWIAGVGPFLYEEAEVDEDGLKIRGLRAEGGISINAAPDESQGGREKVSFYGGDPLAFFAEIFGTRSASGTSLIIQSADVQLDKISLLATRIDVGMLNLVPVTETTRDNDLSPEERDVIWNSDKGRIEYYDGSNWNYLSGTVI